MSKRILLADDSAAAKKSVESALGTTDYQLITAEEGQVAMEQVNSAQPHLVLAHAMLPGIDGYEICRQIKENPGTSHIPVLLLTGTFEPFDINRAKESRYDGFVTKPLDGPELLILVNRCIENAVYPAVDQAVESEPQAGDPEPEEAPGPSGFPGASAVSDTITRSDAMLDRIFPEETSSEEVFDGSDTIPGSTDDDDDIFSIIDSDNEPEEETAEAEPEDTEAPAEEVVDRRSPDFGIWGAAGATTVDDPAAPESETAEVEDPGSDEKQEISSEDSDLSWFLRKYEEKMKIAEDASAGETAAGEQQESDPSAMETVSSIPEIEASVDAVEEEPAEVAEMEEQTEGEGLVQEVTAVPTVSEPVLDSELPPPPDVEAAAPVELNDRQLEQVAGRVVELLSESVVRDVAWEAVPEIAERLIRERIREIEEEAESGN